MKKVFIGVLLALLILVSANALADKNVKVAGIGDTTKEVSHSIAEKGMNYWVSSLGTKSVFAFIAIKNTDSRSIYMDDCTFTYEDDSGKLLDTETFICSAPYVIAPGEIGYFYVSSVNGGYLDNSVDVSNGVNLYAQYTLQRSNEDIDSYQLSDTSISFPEHFGKKYPVVRGTMTNNTNIDRKGLNYVVAVLKNNSGETIYISGTNTGDMYAGTSRSFEISMRPMPFDVDETIIGSYQIIAKPYYYQYEPNPEVVDIGDATISKIEDQVYTGSAIKPTVKVTYKDKTLVSGTDYSLAYSDNTDIGVATVTVAGKGNYTGSQSVTFNIFPKKVASPKLTAGKKCLTLKWKEDKNVDGYEIEYSLKKDFSGAKKITVKKAATTEYEIKKLKANKTYYVRIRSFKKVKGKKFYSDWSKPLSKKVKK